MMLELNYFKNRKHTHTHTPDASMTKFRAERAKYAEKWLHFPLSDLEGIHFIG